MADFNVVKGFLNLVIVQSAWIGLLNDINADEKFGEKKVTSESPLVMIEYSSPNTNKPLHLGHVRNNLLGWSLAQIMEANGNTGPFIQYTYARISSILRKAEAQNIILPASLNDDAPLNEKEIALIQKLNDFSAAVTQAGIDYSPSGIANYCYELTKEFNQFYHDYSILNADTEAEKITRLMIAKNVAKVIKNSMALLGIEVPERM